MIGSALPIKYRLFGIFISYVVEMQMHRRENYLKTICITCALHKLFVCDFRAAASAQAILIHNMGFGDSIFSCKKKYLTRIFER